MAILFLPSELNYADENVLEIVISIFKSLLWLGSNEECENYYRGSDLREEHLGLIREMYIKQNEKEK